MRFTSAAARWFQSVEQQLTSVSWDAFCAMIHERFSRDQHALLLRQLFNIRQTSSVSEYVDKLSHLSNNFLLTPQIATLYTLPPGSLTGCAMTFVL